MDIAIRMMVYIYGLFVLFVGRLVSKSVLHPLRLFAIFWTLLIICATSITKIAYIWDGTGFIYLLTCLLTTELGALIIIKGYGNLKETTFVNDGLERYTSVRDPNWILVYIIIALSFLSVITTLIDNSFHISDFSSFDSMLSMSTEMADRRYNTGERTSAVTKIVSIFGSTSMLCSGYAFNFAKDKLHKILCIGSFVPIILSVIITTAKSGMIAAGVLFLGGWTVSCIKTRGNLPKIKTITLIRLGALFGLFLLFLYFAMFVRVGDFSAATVEVINLKFIEYSMGEMVQFDSWFKNARDFRLYDLGVNTYMTIPKMLGLVERLPGVYTEAYVKEYGNVFTVFRGVIQDYGLIGCLIYFSIRGIITQYCCVVVSRRSSSSYLAMTLIACQCFFGLYGFIISPWIYTTYILCIIIFFCFMWLFNRRICYGT